jgi:hypothetical protein
MLVERNGIGEEAPPRSDEVPSPKWSRLAVYAALAFVLGLALFFAFEIYVFDVLGQSECDRSDCDWIGDLAYGSSANIVFGICLMVAGAIVWGLVWLAGRWRRALRR